MLEASARLGITLSGLDELPLIEQRIALPGQNDIALW